ncbi:MAG: 3-phosphoshikimate 1-carboxyvinyltransferase [Acidobacteria bacterium]|nr:3-phosphoshikimate 1-carboxyvinyltransferase [Acidobacteriota bacterium]
MIKSLRAARTLSGVVNLPGDKSISHRYAMLAAISEGTSVFSGFASSRDCHSTLDCLRALGVEVSVSGDTVAIQGRGLSGLKKSRQVLDAGNSGTTIRLLSGILAGHPFETAITGDSSLSGRPMGRIIRPLQQMGAVVESRDGGLPPLKIRGGQLKSVRYTLPVASAQVKSCVLLAGLYADATTAVEETIPTRSHTEIALREFGATVRISGNWIEVDPNPHLRGQTLRVPGDLSGAAFFLAGAALVPGSELLLPGVGLNPSRRTLLDYLVRSGLDLKVLNEREDAGEPRGDLRVRYSPDLLQSRMPPIQGNDTASMIDEIPVLAVLGAHTAGLEISDAGELRVKESDRISAIAANLRAMGAEVSEKPDGLTIQGGQTLQSADIVTRNDHRIGMAFAVAALAAKGETRIIDAECADVSFPGFWETLAGVAR